MDIRFQSDRTESCNSSVNPFVTVSERRKATPLSKATVAHRGGGFLKRATVKNSIRFNITRSVDSSGYIRIKLPGHPHAASNGWVREHIVVALKHAGLERLPKGHDVHHKDENKQNNDPPNLEIIPRPKHTETHQRNPNNRAYGEPNPEIKCDCGCGKVLLKFDRRGRPRTKIYGNH